MIKIDTFKIKIEKCPENEKKYQCYYTRKLDQPKLTVLL